MSSNKILVAVVLLLSLQAVAQTGPMVLQNGGTGFLSPASPKGRIIFEGYGLNMGQQDLITLGDSDNGTKLFSTAGLRPAADAGDCAVSNDNTAGATWGLAFRCPLSISNYINQPPDGTKWLERLNSTSKSFTVPLVLSHGAQTGTNMFSISPTTPAASRTLTIPDPGGNGTFGLSLGSATIAGPTSVGTLSCTVSNAFAIQNVTTSNTLIETPQSSLNAAGYKGLAVDAFVSSPGMVKLEVCNASAGPISPGTVNFIVKAF